MNLQQAQRELLRHDFDTFLTEEPSIAQGGNGVVVSGCPTCKKRMESLNQFMCHLAEDVLPEIFRLREPGEEGRFY
jgi:hypothetical protein